MYIEPNFTRPLFFKRQKKVLMSLTVISFLLLGCSGGGGGSSSDPAVITPVVIEEPIITITPPTNVATGAYNLVVVDDNIIGAKVSAPECATFVKNGGASYTLKECISAPSRIEAVGGFIDANGDGVQGADEANQAAPLVLKVSQTNLTDGFTVTPLSTLASQEANLTLLAQKLGVSEADLFTDNANNRNLQRSINAMFIAAKEAGIVKYDTFVKDFKDRILASANSGVTALADAKTYMSANQSVYTATHGIVFGGFISDTSSMNLADGMAALETAKGAVVSTGKIRLGGFVYDGVIAKAVINIYDGATLLASTSSDENGRYSLEIAETLLNQSKVLKLEAILAKTKLISYITTDEMKEGLIGQKLSSGTVQDLVISNVTTAKAVLVQKTAPEALTNSKKMTEAKARVEVTYTRELVVIAAAIKDVVDNNKSITQSDTQALAEAIVVVDATTKVVTTNVTAGGNTIDVNSTTIANVTNDPLLNSQLTATKVIDKDSLRAIYEGKTVYGLDYFSEFMDNKFTYGSSTLNTDASHIYQGFKFDGTNWIVFEEGRDNGLSWSSDATTVYVSSDAWTPRKITLVSTETITIDGTPLDIYITQQEVTSEPTAGFFTNFVTNASHQGTINFSSMSDAGDKNITEVYANGSSSVYTLDSNGTYSANYYNGQRYNYRTEVKEGKTYVIFDDGQTNDGSGSIFYLDFTNQKVYRKDYHNMGFKEANYEYGAKVVDVWKNLTSAQKAQLETMLQDAYSQQSLSATNTHYQVGQRVFYQFVKSLDNTTSIAQNTTPPVQNTTPPAVASGGFVDGMTLSGLEMNGQGLVLYQTTLSSNILTSMKLELNASTGDFTQIAMNNNDLVLDANGNWITANYAYALSNGALTLTSNNDVYAINGVLDLQNPSTPEELALAAKINNLVPGDVNVTFSAGALGYAVYVKNASGSYTLWNAMQNCSDWNNTTQTCNVTPSYYPNLVVFMNSNNSPNRSYDATGALTQCWFQRDASANNQSQYNQYPAIDANGSVIGALSVGVNGKLVTVDQNNTEAIVGTWDVIDLPHNAGLAIVLMPTTLSAFEYPGNNFLAVANSMVYSGQVILPGGNFQDNMNLNSIAVNDVKKAVKDYVVAHPIVNP